MSEKHLPLCRNVTHQGKQEEKDCQKHQTTSNRFLSLR